ncbi:hypothetical protein [Sphingomonas sp. CARO-RG-8B-R24-01]|uniref:hypothetical protein n=1 Tax=Sphingomonas sp. CARO-RG-8B-R24-01 TaxID=2914831 RepID=UPI001F58A207|nr:hypothetical protein [Sphingomonas sp. CARO-RG-8B-R24-01]
MSVIKSLSVGTGDMFYITHGSSNFSIIDCNVTEENLPGIVKELKAQSAGKEITRFISTHPDGDHFGGIELLDDAMPIHNFYVVANQATKDSGTDSFTRYCELRDGSKAFKIYKGCSRKWMNQSSDERSSSGLNVLWPDTANADFKAALADAADGGSPNNISAVIRYTLKDGASVLWLGDLETKFMEAITDHIELTKTTIVFASHHGRASGKIPDSWLKQLDPQIIVIGEAPSRHLHYYTGYKTVTQNMAGDITMELLDDKVHFYVSNPTYANKALIQEDRSTFDNYAGSITVETEYTL